jgi:phospholipase C
MKRREALKTIGGLAGAAGLAKILPACSSGSGSNVDAAPPSGITTYVYMMMENRSYDHLFGARSMFEGKAGDGPVRTTSMLDRNDVAVPLWQPDRANLCDLDPPHGWDALRESWNNGACDLFLKVHQREHDLDIKKGAMATEPMQYLTRNEVPVSYALADAYTTCDRWFCSVMGPTWPNRFYWHTGQAFGQKSNELPSQLSPSIYHRLAAKGIDWAYYYGNIAAISKITITDLDVTPHVHRFQQFLIDAAAGTLPPVVYIDPGFAANDDHPPVHPILGQALISSVYKALAASPQWPNILFVLTYDENGGFYDHVSPPTAPDDRAAEGFGQLGFRVPAMVMGPYVKSSYVSSVQYDHTSALRQLENVFGLEALTMRTASANDLTDCIDTARLAAGDWAAPIELPEVKIDDWPMTAACEGTPREHPIVDWADANRGLLGEYDLRDEIDDYKRTIIEFLRNPPRAMVKTPA